MTEAELKSSVQDYLKYGMNQGRWYADRLNSGMAYVKRGEKYYAIRLCEKGTADFFVLMKFPWGIGTPRVIFLEIKGDKGKQSDDQKLFEAEVERQGASYAVIRSIEDLEEAL